MLLLSPCCIHSSKKIHQAHAPMRCARGLSVTMLLLTAAKAAAVQLQQVVRLKIR